MSPKLKHTKNSFFCESQTPLSNKKNLIIWGFAAPNHAMSNVSNAARSYTFNQVYNRTFALTIMFLNWPGKSPDLNPIEIMGQDLK